MFIGISSTNKIRNSITDIDSKSNDCTLKGENMAHNVVRCHSNREYDRVALTNSDSQQNSVDSLRTQKPSKNIIDVKQCSGESGQTYHYNYNENTFKVNNLSS